MPRPVVRFTLGETAATTPYQSKIGGTPYLPKNAGYPHHTEKKHPLTLAAQINFAEVPHLPGFPEHGILQVFIDGLSYNMGWDFENQSAQAGWRIVYYPELLPESELQTDFSAYQAADSDCLPFSGEFPLIFQTASEEEEDADFKKLEGHKIGGCPIFIQGDPFWEYHEDIDFDDHGTDFDDLPPIPTGRNTSCCCNWTATSTKTTAIQAN